MAECGTRGRPMDIAIPLFDRITALDAIGPYEVLSRLPGARIRWVAVTPGPYRTDNRQLTLVADEPLSAVPHPEIIMVPGVTRSEEHTSELQSPYDLVCRLLLE